MNEQLIEAIKSSLGSVADPKRVAFAQGSFPTSLRTIGVTNPNMRIILKELKGEVKKLDGSAIICLAHDMIAQRILELQWLAYELLGSQKKALRALKRQDIDRLNSGLDNWMLTDVFCACVLGFAWREGLLDETYFLKLQASDDVWQRRIAVVATTALNIPANGGSGARRETLLMCQGAVDDHHPMVSKAVSWALRTFVKWDSAAVEQFLESNEDRLARLVVREVNTKLQTGKKNR